MKKKVAGQKGKLSPVEQLQEKPTEFLIVGIGASAGGIQALQEFFRQVPTDSHMAYVVILHLSPDHDSQLAEVLQQVTTLPVLQVTEKVAIEPDHIYVVPPDRHLTIEDAYIAVLPNLQVEERRAPVDIFFRSLADQHGPRAISVILSGTGANGSMGLKRIKERGGATFVQNPREAEFNEMPRNSIATELVDEVLNVGEIPARIIAYRDSIGKVQIVEETDKRPETQQLALREIFTQLRVRTGHDFSNYKRPTLLRRIERRINVHNLPDLPSYTAFLQEHPEETQALLKDLLISVTNFFRDSKAFSALEQEVLPAIFAGKTSEDQVRIWVAGCATGEEAYSLAMLCAEKALNAFDAPKVQIFATDIDESAIATAREGLYTLNDAADVSPERLRRFFTREGDGYRVRREIRETILFAHHNFLKDPPFSKLDLVTCRNVLIYLNNTAQERVLETFHFALKPKSFLFLGTSESLDGAADLYSVLNRDNRIFQAREVSARSYPVPESVPNFHFPKNDPLQKPDEKNRSQRISFGELHQKMLEQYAPPSVVVNEEYEIVHMTERATKYFELAGGEPTQNLLKLIRPQIRLELRTALYQAVQNKTIIEARNLKLSLNGEPQSLDIQIRPVLDDGDTAKGFILVVFKPSEEASQEGSTVRLTSDEPLARQLEEENIGLKTQLRNSIEQHEYQAEELKASNEELQAMNEELRSAAEELETSKEELQSINEELRTVNQELKVKIDETSINSNNLQNLVNSANVGTIFLDRSFAIRLFTPATLEIFNLKSGDYGRPVTDITNKLQYDGLLRDAETVLEKLTVIEREVSTSDNRFYMMRLLPYRTSEDRISGVVITFFDITGRRASEEALRQSEEQMRLLIESAKDYAIFTTDTERRIVSWSSGAEMMMGYSEVEIAGKPADLIFTPEDREKGDPEKEVGTAEKEGRAINERWHLRKDGSRFWGSGSVSPLRNNEGKLLGFVKIMRDLTEQREMEAALRESDLRFRTMADTAPVLIWELDENGITFVNGHYLDFFGVDFEAVRGNGWATFLHPDDAKAYHATLQEAFDQRQPYSYECRFRHADGQYRWLQNVGRPFGTDRFVGCSIDITERKQREANLAFLAQINLGFAPLLSVHDVMDQVGGQLASHLQLSRCHFSIVEEDNDRVEVVYEYRRDGKLPSMMGMHRISDCITEEGRKHYGAGKLAVMNAAADSPLVKTPAHILKELGFGSLIDIPHLEAGRWRFLLTLGRAEEGEWRNDEVEVLQELASKIYIRIERALAEEALRKSEEKYRALFSSIEEGFCIIELLYDGENNIADMIFREVNGAYEKQMGLIDVADKSIKEVLPAMEQSWKDVFTQLIKTREPIQLVHHSPQPDRWFDVHFTMLADKGNFVAAVFNNITERVRNEEILKDHTGWLEQEVADRTRELHQNYALVQTIYDTTLIGMSVFAPVRDAQGAITDFKILMVNRKVETTAKRSDMVGQLYSEIYPGIKQMGLFDLMVKAIETGETGKMEYHYTYEGVDNWYSTMFVRGEDILVSTNLDITERKIAEEKRLRAFVLLKQSEELTGIGSWDYDLLTGNFAWSDGMYRLFNLEKGKEVRPEVYLQYATVECQDIAARIAGHIKHGDAEFEESLTINVGETVKVLKLKATVIKNNEGHPVRVLGVDMDVTATRVAEEKLRQMEAEQQMEIFRVTLRTQEEERRRISESLHNGLGQLLYGIRISMNELTPLFASENDKGYTSAKQYTQELLADAIKESRRISHELMPMALDEFGLTTAVEDICEQLQDGVKFNCQVKLEGIQLDKYFELAVYRTVQELMLNVVKHAEATIGQVDITVKDGRILIRVEDNGNGLAAPNSGKAGIGLASIRSKANLLNGGVNMISTPGKGTVVEVWLVIDATKN